MSQKTLLSFHFYQKNPSHSHNFENTNINQNTLQIYAYPELKSESISLEANPNNNLYNYFHTVQRVQSQTQSPISKLNENSMDIERPRDSSQSKKPRAFRTLDAWLFNCESTSTNAWYFLNSTFYQLKNRLFLPKDLMRKIMQFLPLFDNAKLSYVCKYWNRCYNSIWLSYDFFAKVNFQNLNGKQVKKIFEKSGRLAHIRKMKNIMRGKKVEAFLKRTKFSTKISKEVHNGNLFETFSIKPNKPNITLFITDKEVVDICESSLFSLQYINLTSCLMLTQKSFEALAKCRFIQHLTIKNSR